MTAQPCPHGTVYQYAIHVEERLDEHWSAWFDGMSIQGGDGGTVLEGPVADQTALHGLLAKLRNLNLTLISVQRLAPVLEYARKD